MQTFRILLPAVVLLACVVSLDGRAQPAAGGEAILTDANGKEHKVKGWKWTAGTRHLTWLDPKEAVKLIEPIDEKKVKAPPKVAPVRPTIGPEALQFREVESTTYQNGVVTLIPLDRLRALEFDATKKTVTARIDVGGDKGETALVGSTLYKDTNTSVIEAEIDRGPMGVAALKFLGGVPTGGIQKATFPQKMNAAFKPGRTVNVTIVHDKKKAVQAITDLQPLYQLASGTEVVAPAMLFKKSLKVDLADIRKMVCATPGQLEATFDVTLKDNSTETLTALNQVKLDGKEATLVGFVGKVPAGWKIYPLHTITEIEVVEKGAE